jgi:signal transduction histidine kinase
MGFRAALGVPLIREGHTFGVINLFRFAVGSFEPRQIEIVETFADQAVIAIENARLFDEVQARTRDLTEALTYQTGSANILKVIASSPTDVAPVLQAIVESACELCEAYDAVVMLKDGEELCLGAHHGPIPMSRQRWSNDRTSVSGRAMADCLPVHIHDMLSDEGAEFVIGREMSRVDGCHTLLGAPLLREGEAIGAILLRRAEVHPFSDKQIALLQTFADQAVIALGNVRLFDEVQARTRDLAKSLDELRTAQDRLIQTEKLASLGQLTAGIAHEIKNPLNFINNFSALSVELLAELGEALAPAALDKARREEIDELAEMLKGNLEKVVQHGKRADSIVKNMLLHSRSGSSEPRRVEINAIIDESLNLAYHGARAEKQSFNVTLERELDPEAGMAEVFPQEITRVFLNMISNGFYAAAKRAAQTGNGFEPRLKAVTRGLPNRVEIRIRDNGTGIAPEVKEKIFDPFFTTKPPGEGTGLGLSMSHDIVVKQHGGTIDVDSEPGVFTEFIITLPRTTRARESAGDAN